MKKVLLTGLFCATLMSSFTGFAKTNESNGYGEQEYSNLSTPKIKKQNLNVAEYGALQTVDESISEAQINSIGEISIGDVSLAENQSIEKASAEKYAGDLELAEVDFDFNEKIKIDPDIISGPIFDPNPSEEGGTSNPQQPITLTTFYDSEKDSSENKFDDYSYYANVVDSQAVLSGSITVHPSAELTYIRQRGNASSVDKDWFRFSLEEKSKFSFNFSSYSSGYYFNLYRFSQNAFGGVHASDQNHTLVRSSKSYGNAFDITLVPATYFICVTANSSYDIGGLTSYTLTYTRSIDLDGDLKVHKLSDANIANYPVVLWENDKKPFQVDRWNGNEQTIFVYYNYDVNSYPFEGYLDPLFMDYQNWRPSNKDYGMTSDKLYLDSVSYICDLEDIKEIRDAAETVLDALEEESRNNKAKEYVKSVKTKKEMENDLNLQTTRYVLSYFAEVPYLGDLIELGECYFTHKELAEAFAELTEYEVYDYDYNSPTIESLVSGYTRLSDVCTRLIDDGRFKDYVLKFPKYSYMHMSEKNYYENENGDSCPSHAKIFKWFSLPFVSYFSKQEDFMHPRSLDVTKNQTARVCNEATFRGTITRFSSYDDYARYTNSSSTFYPLYRKMNYKIEKSGSTYTLNVTNRTQNQHTITYNNADVTKKEGENFNFKANVYSSKLITNQPFSTSLGKRNYIYVRENDNDYVFKVSYEEGKTIISDPIYFGMQYLKLSIVKKSGTKWTIRIRNLFTSSLPVSYNTKMCNYGDAENWKGLKNIMTVNIPKDNYLDVGISENWFATSIAVSHVREGKRYVSFADGLNAVANSLSYKTKLLNA